MRHLTFLLPFLLLTCLLSAPHRARAQEAEIQQLLLNVEKLRQFKAILSDMKQGYEILHQGYTAVKDISEGSFSLHRTFLDGLLAVNPALAHYRRVADIIACQQHLARELGDAERRFRQAGTFSPEELAYLAQVYGNLSHQSLRHLDELALVLTAGKLRMDDGERLQAIDRIFREAEDQLAFLRDFNRQAALLSLQRAREQTGLQRVQDLLRLP